MIWQIDLAWLAGQMGLLPCRTICECAVGPMEISVAPGFKEKCEKMILVEPNPTLAMKAEAKIGMPITQVAIGFELGKQILIENNGSSYLEGTWSPTPRYQDIKKHSVPVITFDMIDDGKIDVLALDCEGMEWAVLSKMTSKPKLLTIEIWDGNPHKEKIYNWLEKNGYTMRFSTGPTTETQLYTWDGKED